MMFAILASLDTLNRLERKHRGAVFVHTSNSSILINVVRHEPIDGVWIDSASVAVEGLPWFRKLRLYPTTPIILSGPISQLLAEEAVRLSEWTNPQIILENFDCAAALVERFVNALPPVHTRNVLLRRSRDRLADLPPELESALAGIVNEPLRDQTLPALLTRANCSSQYFAPSPARHRHPWASPVD
jgi:hypothetical protein